MLERVKNAGWIAAFIALCIGWGYEVVDATRQSRAHSRDGGAWICPIAGNCGPAGTPGLGKW